ncbi:hypothetical protein DFJ74DRAFT_472262 [Hyaloraphidium curvatum]|nr:hypothetical protein DFJ74DRAFT_472262 [Hyaloraphidium curvatum]
MGPFPAVNIVGRGQERVRRAGRLQRVLVRDYPANRTRQDRTVAAEDNQAELKLKKAWDVVSNSAKGIPMNAFMLYMSGGGVQIFSIMMTGMQLWNGFQGLMNTDKVFERFVIAPGPTNLASLVQRSNPNAPLLGPKLLYILLQLVIAGLGLYKMSSMGLLPTAKSDWLAWESPQPWTEWSGGGVR